MPSRSKQKMLHKKLSSSVVHSMLRDLGRIHIRSYKRKVYKYTNHPMYNNTYNYVLCVDLSQTFAME